jgi:hypothetical protein
LPLPKIDTLLSELETLESTFLSRTAASDIEGAIRAMHRAAAVDLLLGHELGRAGRVTGGVRFRRVRERQLSVLALIDRLKIEGRDHLDVSEWPESFVDEHLGRLIDFTDPNWPIEVDRRLVEAGLLITQAELPNWVARHFQNARRCYGLAMHAALFVFLRALVEAVSFDWVARKRKLSGQGRVRSLTEWRLQESLAEIRGRGPIPISLMKKVDDVVRRANVLIHRKRAVDEPTESEALRALRDVISYCERLST